MRLHSTALIASLVLVAACSAGRQDEPSSGDLDAPGTDSTSSDSLSEPAESGGIEVREVRATESSTPDRAPLGDVADAFDELDCSADAESSPAAADEAAALCGLNGRRYAVEPALAVLEVDDAQAFRDESGFFQINITFADPDAASDATGRVGTGEEVAFVSAGQVLTTQPSTSSVSETLVVSGDFDEVDAQELTDRLTS